MIGINDKENNENGSVPAITVDADTGGGDMPFSAEALYQIITDRKINRKPGSYTTYLFDKGIDKILKKIGEESAEVIIAGKADDKAETIYEIADLTYHALVLMAEMGITPGDIVKELASRHGLGPGIRDQEELSP